MPKFFTSFEPAKCVCCPSGDGTEPEMKMKIIKGVQLPEEVGRVNIYDKIQASADSVDLNRLIEIYETTGNPDVLNQRRAEFFDTTQYPKDMFEMQALIAEAQERFDNLPARIKDRYNNNVYDFVNDDKSFEKLKDYFKVNFDSPAYDKTTKLKTEAISKSEVKSNE